jgi:L-erythro-3,5-diaminohexanoate dehydrogenase
VSRPGLVTDPAVLGAWRSLQPRGTLPHLAARLDAAAPASEYEAEVEVELLNVDAASFRQLRESCRADPAAMSSAISAIVREHGKMQNPATGSGGVLVGRLTAVGSSFWQPGLEVGQRVIPLVSLIATPLELHAVGPVDPADPQVPVRGRAIVTGRMSVAVVPDDLPLRAVLTAIDVYPAASHTKALARPGAHLLVIGCGHAGLAAVAAASEQLGPEGVVTAVDTSPGTLRAASRIHPGCSCVLADATDPVALARQLADRGLPPADLTLLCTTVPGCEGAAILLTADDGTVLFFSTVTSFAAAGLGADSVSSLAALAIPNGYTPDRGSYLLELLRRCPPLLDAYLRRGDRPAAGERRSR